METTCVVWKQPLHRTLDRPASPPLLNGYASPTLFTRSQCPRKSPPECSRRSRAAGSSVTCTFATFWLQIRVRLATTCIRLRVGTTCGDYVWRLRVETTCVACRYTLHRTLDRPASPPLLNGYASPTLFKRSQCPKKLPLGVFAVQPSGGLVRNLAVRRPIRPPEEVGTDPNKLCRDKVTAQESHCRPRDNVRYSFSMNKPLLTEEERRIFRTMSPADKLRLVASIHMQARTWKRAAFRAQRPDWTPEQIDQRVREVFLYGTG